MYLARAEEIRNIAYKRHEQISIAENSTGHGYRAVFGKYLDDGVRVIEIKDAYVREHFQIENFVKFLEVVKSSCKNLRRVELVTGKQGNGDVRQTEAFEEIKRSLSHLGVEFDYSFSSTLHDREIKLVLFRGYVGVLFVIVELFRFDSGWVVKIGRGLNYFKKPDSKYSLGAFDLNFRKCLETTIDIFHLEKVSSHN